MKYHECKRCGTYIAEKEGKYCIVCKDKVVTMKLKSVLVCAVIAILVTAIFGTYAAIRYRGAGFYDCVMRQIEENRETDFTWWRGRCFYVQKDGTQIPVIQSRTITGHEPVEPSDE